MKNYTFMLIWHCKEHERWVSGGMWTRIFGLHDRCTICRANRVEWFFVVLSSLRLIWIYVYVVIQQLTVWDVANLQFDIVEAQWNDYFKEISFSYRLPLPTVWYWNRLYNWLIIHNEARMKYNTVYPPPQASLWLGQLIQPKCSNSDKAKNCTHTDYVPFDVVVINTNHYCLIKENMITWGWYVLCCVYTFSSFVNYRHHLISLATSFVFYFGI
jgi:hypothetical protein